MTTNIERSSEYCGVNDGLLVGNPTMVVALCNPMLPDQQPQLWHRRAKPKKSMLRL